MGTNVDDLEEWLSGQFDEIANRAETSGETAADAADALLRLACARVLAVKANADTEAEIKKALASIHGKDG